MSTAGKLLWSPSKDYSRSSNLTQYMRWLANRRGLRFDSYDALWRWSVTDYKAFWGSIWDFFGVGVERPADHLVASGTMPRVDWFPGARLNYAECALRRRDDHPALVFAGEGGVGTTMTFPELAVSVGEVAAGLKRLGVKPLDRIVAYTPNIPEAVVGLLATASLGAVWASCSPEFGPRGVLDRFRQIEPKILVTADGYRYGGREHDRLPSVAEIQSQLPSLEATIQVPYLRDDSSMQRLPHAISWRELQVTGSPPKFISVPFDHPLWILYSSGTTGPPKAIVQTHGGIVLEHLKLLSLHLNLKPDDRFFWFTTTGWMMWNLLLSALLLGTTAVLYDG